MNGTYRLGAQQNRAAIPTLGGLVLSPCIVMWFVVTLVKGIYLSKALICMTLFIYKQKMLFIKETDTLDQIVA